MDSPYQGQNNEYPFKKYCNDDCGACSDKNKDKKIEQAVEVLRPIVSNIICTLATVIQETAKTMDGLLHSIIECYPNRLVVYLALYHPEEMVRKKSIQRIMRRIRNE